MSLPAGRINQQVTSCELLQVSLEFACCEYFAPFPPLKCSHPKRTFAQLFFKYCLFWSQGWLAGVGFRVLGSLEEPWYRLLHEKALVYPCVCVWTDTSWLNGEVLGWSLPALKSGASL